MQAGLIPEIFFDLIGRVVPGALALVALAVTWWGPDGAFLQLSQELDDGKKVLLFLILSYIAAIVIAQIGSSFHSLGITLYGAVVERKKPSWRGGKGDERVGQAVEEYFALFAANGPRKASLASLQVRGGKVQDWILGQIRCEQPGEANRLLKILAEKSLCHVLTASFSLLIVINVAAAGLDFCGLDLWGSLKTGPVWRLVFVGLLVMGVLALVKWRAELDDFLAFALASYWYHRGSGEQAQVRDPAATAS